MNEQAIESWQKLMHLAGIKPKDANKFMMKVRRGYFLDDYLNFINPYLSKLGTKNTIEALRILILAYPSLLAKSADYAKKAIEEILIKNSIQYDISNLPVSCHLDSKKSVDVIGALDDFIHKGVELNGFKVKYADSESLDLLIFFNVKNYPPFIMNDSTNIPNNSTKEYVATNIEDDIKYSLSYNPTLRKLYLNGHLLANPQYGSENDQFLRFFVSEGNTGEHSIDELLHYMKKQKLTKRPTQILGDLKITGDVKILFFPNASVKGIEFRNPITHQYAKDNNLPEIDIDKVLKSVRNNQK